jgi:hypothetical protein
MNARGALSRHSKIVLDTRRLQGVNSPPIMMAALPHSSEPGVVLEADALALKGNQGTLHDDVRLLLDDPECKAAIAVPDVEGDHGRVEALTATVSIDIGWLQKEHKWPGLAALGKVVRVRETADRTNGRNRVLLAQHGLAAGETQPSHSSALGRGKQPALATEAHHERGSRLHPDGQRGAQPRNTPAHGSECDAEGKDRKDPCVANSNAQDGTPTSYSD